MIEICEKTMSNPQELLLVINSIIHKYRNIETAYYSLLNMCNDYDKIFISVEQAVLDAYEISSASVFYGRKSNIGVKKQIYTQDEKAGITVLIYILMEVYKIPSSLIEDRYKRRPNLYVSNDINLGQIVPIRKIFENKKDREIYIKIIEGLNKSGIKS